MLYRAVWLRPSGVPSGQSIAGVIGARSIDLIRTAPLPEETVNRIFGAMHASVGMCSEGVEANSTALRALKQIQLPCPIL